VYKRYSERFMSTQRIVARPQIHRTEEKPVQYTPASIVSEGHVVLTGPITGTVTLDDGTVVDVTQPVIEVADKAQADAVAHQIGQRYAAEGHPEVPEGFVYDGPGKTTTKKKG
jgi:hypothetical protein